MNTLMAAGLCSIVSAASALAAVAVRDYVRTPVVHARIVPGGCSAEPAHNSIACLDDRFRDLTERTRALEDIQGEHRVNIAMCRTNNEFLSGALETLTREFKSLESEYWRWRYNAASQ